jgi:hypothetical protein
MKAQRGRSDIAPHILNLGARWSFTPPPLYFPEEPQYPLQRWLVGPQRQSGRFGEEKDLLSLLGIQLTVRLAFLQSSHYTD